MDTKKFQLDMSAALNASKAIAEGDYTKFRENFDKLTPEDLTKSPANNLLMIAAIINSKKPNDEILKAFIEKCPEQLDDDNNLVGPPLIQAVNRGWVEAALYILEVRPSTYKQTRTIKAVEDFARKFGIPDDKLKDALYWAKSKSWPPEAMQKLETAMATAREKAAQQPASVPESRARG